MRDMQEIEMASNNRGAMGKGVCTVQGGGAGSLRGSERMRSQHLLGNRGHHITYIPSRITECVGASQCSCTEAHARHTGAWPQ